MRVKATRTAENAARTFVPVNQIKIPKPASTARRTQRTVMRCRDSMVLLLKGHADVHFADLRNLGGDHLGSLYAEIQAINRDIAAEDDGVSISNDLEIGGHVLGLTVDGQVTGERDGGR